jgi:thiol-disulfide isomerase/thioredoxin
MRAMRKTATALVLVALIAGCNKRGEKPADTTAKRGAPTQTATATTATTPPAPGTDVGAVMPEYDATNLDGTKFELAGKRDKVVLVNVWATWCGPCRFEIPELQKIDDTYKAKGLEVVGISVDESGVDSVKQFVAENKMKYLVAIDPQGKIAAILQTSVLPTTILVGRDGRILWKKYGPILENDQELKGAIEKAL